MTPSFTTHFSILTCLTLLLVTVESRCRYNIDRNLDPFHVDTEPFLLGDLQACRDYVTPDQLGCCNQFNDATTASNFKTIDSIFGSAGGGCDLCAINLKRFWCQYACSDRQDDFMDTGKEWQMFPDPQNPTQLIPGQRVNVRVHADTACALFQSCKRVPFVASVSAMGTPAGFLNFQGHNAISSGKQYISMNFSYDLNGSLSFDDSLGSWATSNLSLCSETVPVPDTLVHNFTVEANCSCNTCDSACNDDGFRYEEPAVLEGFNWKLVLGVYGVVGFVTVGLTVKRKCDRQKDI